MFVIAGNSTAHFFIDKMEEHWCYKTCETRSSIEWIKYAKVTKAIPDSVVKMYSCFFFKLFLFWCNYIFKSCWT